MGHSHSKNNFSQNDANDNVKRLTNNDIIDIIYKYEYIKNKKNINDVNAIIPIMYNTNWEVINAPSAPPLP